jgi:ATP-independent RNA helicase DbpA
VIAQAPTGSGKTAAFGLGLLQSIDPSLIRVQALVLCPTRELADQVGKQIRKLATGIPNLKLLLLVGGVPLGPQLASLEGTTRMWWSARPAACRNWHASAR